MDRHTKTTEIATTSIPLKDIKLLVISEVPVQFTQKMNEVRHVSIYVNIKRGSNFLHVNYKIQVKLESFTILYNMLFVVFNI